MTGATDAGGSPAYLAGLLLAGRKVVVVGAGRVAARRIPTLAAAGARLTVIAPALHASLADRVEAGTLDWLNRPFRPGDLAGSWYAMAATNSADVNAEVAAEAEAARIFCVRADLADGGSAWTPASGAARGATVAVVTNHDPLRAKRLRDRLVDVIVEEGW